MLHLESQCLLDRSHLCQYGYSKVWCLLEGGGWGPELIRRNTVMEIRNKKNKRNTFIISHSYLSFGQDKPICLPILKLFYGKKTGPKIFNTTLNLKSSMKSLSIFHCKMAGKSMVLLFLCYN